MRLLKSIRARLLFWLAFLLVCILTGFGVTAYQLHRVNQFRQIDEDLERRVAALSADVRGRGPGGPPFRFDRPGPDLPQPEGNPTERPPGPPPRNDRSRPPGNRMIRLSEPTATMFDESDPRRFYYSVWSRDGLSLKSSTNAPAGLLRPPRTGPDTRPHARTTNDSREVYHFTELGECVLAGRSIKRDLAASTAFAWWMGVAGAIILAVGLGGGGVIVTRAFRPIRQIGASARRIAAGNLAERISVSETDSELGQLAGVLNSTFARLDSAFAEEKQFTADASHELRTPLAVIISEAQTTLARPRSSNEYRETVENCLQAAQQMRRLAESLLQLARFDAGQEPIRRERFDLVDAVQSAVSLVRPLATRNSIEISVAATPMELVGDPDRVHQVLTNLLTNAIQYNRPGGRIDITAQPENGFVRLQIADTGEGIAKEELPRVFERFYRVDKSRSRAEGRSGLGLAISKAIVEAHGGHIDVVSEPGVGTTFSVHLPSSA